MAAETSNESSPTGSKELSARIISLLTYHPLTTTWPPPDYILPPKVLSSCALSLSWLPSTLPQSAPRQVSSYMSTQVQCRHKPRGTNISSYSWNIIGKYALGCRVCYRRGDPDANMLWWRVLYTGRVVWWASNYTSVCPRIAAARLLVSAWSWMFAIDQ